MHACRLVADHTQSASSDNHEGVCAGEIEALNWLAPGQLEPSLRSCVPDGVSVPQMAQAVVAFIDKNRDRASEPFEGLTLEALASVWPCEKNKGGWLRWLLGSSE